MKLTTLLLTLAIMQVSASSFAQRLSLSAKNAPLEKVFKEIRKQSGYDFVFTTTTLNNSRRVNIQVKNADIADVLKLVFEGQPLDYKINDKSVAVSKREPTVWENLISRLQTVDIQGKITDENGLPLAGATIQVKETGKVVSADVNGAFVLKNVEENAILEISYIGYARLTVKATDNLSKLVLLRSDSKLDEVQVIAYGTTTKRLNTGSVTSIKAEDIARQPVSNPLAVLAGTVPGLIAAQSNGNAGATIKVQIRGLNSISQGSTPLFIVDGVPFSNSYLGALGSLANGGQSPFDNINPADIESIDVLKDADATAIYGSRGANGVILISTKKGKPGKTKFEANVYQGAAEVSRKIDLLNTEQYIAMRREAFKNDNVVPTALNAPDLVSWDNNRYTDWQDYLIGGTSHNTNANTSLSGGSESTQYMLSMNYNRQTSVYPGDFADNRGIGRFSISNKSLDGKFKMSVSGSYTANKNRLPSDLTRYIILAPNAPALYDANGNLNWAENGGTFINPLAYTLKDNTVTSDNFLSNINLSYEIFRGLTVKTTAGYNLTQLNEIYTNPIASQDPASSRVATANFSNVTSKNWIIEPQLDYTAAWGKSKLSALLGTTIENNIRNNTFILAQGFPNDDLIYASGFATTVTAQTSLTNYRYQALFGRLNYNYDNKYLLNVTARRDGSSRFGPGKQLSNFGAIGAAWVFTEESFIKDAFPFLSFGKLRGSYGITGNDQIGDYQFRDNYGSTSAYQGQVAYTPSRLFNADYTWERTKKLEGAVELNFLSDRLNFTASYYRNRSDNQLINYTLPSQTGFTSILRNFPANIQNSGWEFELSSTNIQRKDFKWTSSFNITLPKNELLDFPDLATSSYANRFVIGEPITIQKLFEYQGVDPTTGLYTFNGTAVPANQTSIKDTAPKFYGGLSNTISYKNLDLSFLFQFTKQDGINQVGAFSNVAPGALATGGLSNQPSYVLSRWQNPGEIADVQKFTLANSLGSGFNYLTLSDAVISDASFIRLKNLSLGYRLPDKFIKKIRAGSARFYIQGQNLLTITHYKGLDPETATAVNGPALPTLKMMVIGFQTTF